MSNRRPIMHGVWRMILLVTLIGTSGLAACSSPGHSVTPTAAPLPPTPIPVTSSPTPEAPTPAPTAALAPPAASPTSQPTMPQPEASPTAGASSRIAFAPGTSGARIIGDLLPEAIDSYALRAGAGQILTVAVASPAQDVLLGVVGPDGQPLKRTAVGQPVWSGQLAASGDYVLQAAAAGAASAYTMTVAVLPSSGDGRNRIQFPPGATTEVVRGRLGFSAADQYILRASAGQWADVSIATDGDGAVLTMMGADGIPLLASTAQGTVWRGVLPTSQDYWLDVISTGGEVSYDLVVTICSRIEFEAGATSARVTGRVQKGYQGCHVLRALQGQVMEVALESPNDSILLSVVGADGVPLKRYVDGQSFWMGTLPAGQDYFLQPYGGGQDSDYTLTVKVHPLHTGPLTRIQFAAGATQAVVRERLLPGESDWFVLRAQEGQWMDLTAWPQGAVTLTVEGSDGSYWGLGSVQSALTIEELPATQDYTIIVSRALDPRLPLDYSLVVTVVSP